jgi:hypothetical protein
MNLYREYGNLPLKVVKKQTQGLVDLHLT